MVNVDTVYFISKQFILFSLLSKKPAHISVFHTNFILFFYNRRRKYLYFSFMRELVDYSLFVEVKTKKGHYLSQTLNLLYY